MHSKSTFDNSNNAFNGQNANYNDDLMGKTMVSMPKKKLFGGISVAQLLAGAAAAATSMLLASKIGIAGSVIGAAVSSVVTVVSSQLYRNALDASAAKLRMRQLASVQTNAQYPHESQAWDPNSPYDAELSTAHQTYQQNLRPGARIAPSKLRARAAAERNANARKIAWASAGIAALAVVLCAGIILLSTAGEGIGTKPAPIFSAAPAAEDSNEALNQTSKDDSIKQSSTDASTNNQDATSADGNSSSGTDSTGNSSSDNDGGNNSDSSSNGSIGNTGNSSGNSSSNSGSSNPSSGDSSSSNSNTGNSSSSGSNSSSSNNSSTSTGTNAS